MNNKEKILRYFSDLMSSEEIASFNDELRNSAELRVEFDKIQSQINELKGLNVNEISEIYFANQRVNLTERIKKFNHHFTRKVVLIPVAVLALFILSRLFIPSNRTDVISEEFDISDYFSLSNDDDLNDFEENYFPQMRDFSTEEKLNFMNKNMLTNSDLFQSIAEIDEEIVSAVQNKQILQRGSNEN